MGTGASQGESSEWVCQGEALPVTLDMGSDTHSCCFSLLFLLQGDAGSRGPPGPPGTAGAQVREPS